MKIKNIEVKNRLKEIEKMKDYYLKVKSLSELAGTIAFYGLTKDDEFSSLKECEKQASNTIEMLLERYKI